MRAGRIRLLSGFSVVAVFGVLAAPGHAAKSPAPDAIDHRASPPSTTTRNEPAVAVNPRDPHVVVTAANDYGTAGIAAYYSRDGGHNWSMSALPKDAGGSLGSDPNLAYDSRGRLYAAYVSYSYTPAGTFDFSVGGLTVARSDDGGRNWPGLAETVVRNHGGNQGCAFADFPTVAVDARPGHDSVYVGWQSIRYAGADCSTVSGLQLEVVRSDDHGHSWTRPVIVDNDGGYIPRLTVGPDGSVFLAYAWSSGALGDCLSSGWTIESRVAVSHDRGRTFTSHVAQQGCGNGTQTPGVPVLDDYLASYTGATYRLPSNTNTAVDPRTGVVVDVLGAQDPVTGAQLVYTARSFDGGRTWRAGGSVAAQPGEDQQFPWIAAGRNGHLSLVYIAQLPGGFLLASHTTSQDDGRTWSPPTRIASVPSHVHGPFYLGFVGDYIGTAIGSDGLAHPVWTDLREMSVGPVGSLSDQPLDGGTIYTRSVAS